MAPTSPPSVNGAAQTKRLLAPVWHTALVLLLIIGIAALNLRTAPAALSPTHRSAGAHFVLYGVTLVWEWLLLALVWWGLHLRATPLRQLLGIRRPGAVELWTDVAIGAGFWFASLIALGAAAFALRFAHLHPEDIRQRVEQLAPASPAELAAWIALSITAGFCEEMVFRGYLQQQFTVLARRVWLGIAFSALVFGCAHGYEGLAGMLLIALYGAFFGILALLRRSLRAGIFAHAWHDAMSGIALYFGAHLLHRIPH